MAVEHSNITTVDIREQFLDYFRENDHQIIEGSGIIPIDDPTLLFINSGMAPLKPYFRDEKIPPSARLANSQVCIRTTDIEDVGDPHHGTSFRMLGNWSFGSYGKPEAIDLAMGLLTDRFNLPEDKLFATVFKTNSTTPDIPSDNVSAGHWRKYLTVDNIVPSGPEDNLWGPAGDTGPCGPCTEVFFDRGAEYGAARGDTVRGIEIWNAGVFMEYDKREDGSLVKLGRMCVDAGAGLERFAMIMQAAPSIHQIDQYLPAYEQINDSLQTDTDARLAFDHLKTSQILIESGVTPDKKGSGYVLRRLIRRTLATLDINGVKAGTLLNMHDAVRKVVDPVPMATVNGDEVRNVLQVEMNGFAKVLKAFNKFMAVVNNNGEVSSKQVFDATTSLGIPVDLIKDACRRNNILFPETDYLILVSEHKRISKLKSM